MEQVTKIVGICQTMCPVDEFHMRQRENLLHPLEQPRGQKPVGGHRRGRGRGRGRGRARPVMPAGDINLAVKEYSRPAAGRSDPDPTTLRPPSVLQNTVNFLFNTIISSVHVNDPSWSVIYDYVFDRLRAVRQDMVIQEISGQDAITVLEACVRFHVYSAYRLCENKMDTYDPVINSHHTQECLKRLLSLYKQTDCIRLNNQKHQEQTTVDHISDRFADACNVDETKESSSQNALEKNHCEDDSYHDKNHLKNIQGNRGEFESIYLLYNLGDTDALRHFLRLPKSLRCQGLPSLAYQMSINFLLGNILRVIRLASQLPSILCLCAFHRHLAWIQSHGMKILCTAYSSKNCRYPISHLAQVLAFDSESAAEESCFNSGIDVKDGKAFFQKTMFKAPEKVVSRHWDFLEGKLSTVNVCRTLSGKLENEGEKFL